MVAVQQLDGHAVTRLRSVRGKAEDRFVRVTERTLPEADIPGGDVDIARELAKVPGVGVRCGPDALRPEEPAVQHGDTGAGVAQADHEVDR